MCLLKQYEQVAITDITKQLQEANLFNKPGILQTVWVLHGLIDKDSTVEIDGKKHKRGATRPVAQETIAHMIGVKRRATAHGYLKELIDAGIVRAEHASFQGKKCYRYIFTIFDKYAEKYASEDASTEESTPNSTAQGVHSQYNQEVQDPPDNTNGVSTGTAPKPPEAVGGILNQFEAELIDVIPVEEAKAEPAEDEEKASPKEKNADSSLSQQSFALEHQPTESDSDNAERSEATPEPVSENNAESDVSSAAPPPDIVPNGHIGKMVDTLTKDKQMGATPTHDDNLEAFMEVFKHPDGVVWKWEDSHQARKLRGHFEELLSAAGLDMTPIRFFEGVIEETQNWVADGKIVSPVRFNFYLNAASGKAIVESVVEKRRSENRAKSSIEETRKYLDEFKSFQRSEMPPEVKQQMEVGFFDHISPRAQELIKKGIAHRNAGRNEAYYQAVQTAYRICPCDETQDYLDKAIEFTGEVT